MLPPPLPSTALRLAPVLLRQGLVTFRAFGLGLWVGWSVMLLLFTAATWGHLATLQTTTITQTYQAVLVSLQAEAESLLASGFGLGEETLLQTQLEAAHYAHPDLLDIHLFGTQGMVHYATHLAYLGTRSFAFDRAIQQGDKPWQVEQRGLTELGMPLHGGRGEVVGYLVLRYPIPSTWVLPTGLAAALCKGLVGGMGLTFLWLLACVGYRVAQLRRSSPMLLAAWARLEAAEARFDHVSHALRQDPPPRP